MNGELKKIDDDFEHALDACKREGYKTAYKLFLRLAEQGDCRAQCSLGWIYENGKGIPQDYKEAVKWYRLAAEQGHPEAQYKLGVMHENGKGVLQDKDKAVNWYLLSAEHEEKARCKLTAMNDKGVLSQFIINTMNKPLTL